MQRHDGSWQQAAYVYMIRAKQVHDDSLPLFPAYDVFSWAQNEYYDKPEYIYTWWKLMIFITTTAANSEEWSHFGKNKIKN